MARKKRCPKLKTDERPRHELQTFKVRRSLEMAFYVVGRETPGGAVVFMRMYLVGGMPSRHWGALKFADRYLMFGDAMKAADNAPRQYESDEPAAVWRVEVIATKES